mgnify:CR=1 FL=1
MLNAAVGIPAAAFVYGILVYSLQFTVYGGLSFFIKL